MIPTIRRGAGAVFFVAGLLAIQPVEAQTRTRPDTSTRQQPRMTRQQFEALPPDHVLQLGTKRITKRELIAQAEQRRAAFKKHLATVAAADAAAFETQRAAFAKQQAAAIQAENTKTRQQFASMRGSTAGTVRTTAGSRSATGASSSQREAIQREAAELYAASKKASTTERARINKRAAELLQQLQRVPR